MPELTIEQARDAVATYDALRERCLTHLKDHPEVLGKHAWLRVAIQEYDIEFLTVTDSGVEGSGSTYTRQTMGTETFTFTIPFAVLFS